MGKSHTYRNWAVTITGPAAKLPPTPREGTEFTFADKQWIAAVGPPEGGHEHEHLNQHLGIKCKTNSVSKTAARNALMHFLNCEESLLQHCYFKQIEMSWNRWVDYCFKQNLGTVGSAIKTAQEKLRNSGRLPTKRAIQEILAMEHDFEYYCKRLKPALNEYVTLDCMTDDRGTRKDVMDPAVNKAAFEQSFALLQGQIYLAVTRKRCETTWEQAIWSTLGDNEKRLFCELLALLPICTKRCGNVPDKLPGLYLWGQPNTGKSAFFDNGVFLRKFPQDSQGVSRFRLELMNSGLLFDDIPDGFIDRQDISGTLRQMVLGGNTNIKTHGSTESVVGYIIVTSNLQPQFLMDSKPANVEMPDDQWLRNQAAWKRRFITLELREPIDSDPISVIWTDPKLRDYAASLVVQICFLFKDTCPELYNKYLKEIERLLITDYGLGENDAEENVSVYQKAYTPEWGKTAPNALQHLMGVKNPEPVKVRNPFKMEPEPEAVGSSANACAHGRQYFCSICGKVNKVNV